MNSNISPKMLATTNHSYTALLVANNIQTDILTTKKEYQTKRNQVQRTKNLEWGNNDNGSGMKPTTGGFIHSAIAIPAKALSTWSTPP